MVVETRKFYLFSLSLDSLSVTEYTRNRDVRVVLHRGI